MRSSSAPARASAGSQASAPRRDAEKSRLVGWLRCRPTGGTGELTSNPARDGARFGRKRPVAALRESSPHDM